MVLIILLLGMNNIINRSSIEELLMTYELLTFINGVYDWLIDWLIDWLGGVLRRIGNISAI